jgi:hypothetical protein
MYRKWIVGLILLIVNAIPTILLAQLWLVALEPPRIPALDNSPHAFLGSDNSITKAMDAAGLLKAGSVLLSLLVVVVIFFLSLIVLWILSKIGGPLSGDVKASISKFGGKVSVAAAAVVGAFLAIAIVGVGSVYLLAR